MQPQISTAVADFVRGAIANAKRRSAVTTGLFDTNSIAAAICADMPSGPIHDFLNAQLGQRRRHAVERLNAARELVAAVAVMPTPARPAVRPRPVRASQSAPSPPRQPPRISPAAARVPKAKQDAPQSGLFFHRHGCKGTASANFRGCLGRCYYAAAEALGIDARDRLSPADRARVFGHWRNA
jgi:hypothetical protein